VTETRDKNTTLETSLQEITTLMDQIKRQKDREVSLAAIVSDSRYLLRRTGMRNWKHKFPASRRKYLQSRIYLAELWNRLLKMQTLRYFSCKAL